LGILAGSLILIPAIGDTTWIMGELKPVADRLHVGERFEGYHVADILDAMTDRLMACCPNVPPTAVDDELRTILGATEYIEVLANDEDLDLDALSIMGVGTPPHGQASHTWNMVRYVAPSDWCGWDPVTYEVSDGQGHTVEATLLVMIECGPVISEIELNPAGPDDRAEWIELHNASNERVSPRDGSFRSRPTAPRERRPAGRICRATQRSLPGSTACSPCKGRDSMTPTAGRWRCAIPAESLSIKRRQGCRTR